jgi:succinate dehydrogenase / fumarate reductase, flavoprotein subunit
MHRLTGLRDEFVSGIKMGGTDDNLNKNLEFAGRVGDYLELGQLMITDALHRKESCGGHFRVEYQTEQGEAQRNDEQFAYVAAWEYRGQNVSPVLHKEPLTFENVKLSERSYQ